MKRISSIIAALMLLFAMVELGRAQVAVRSYTSVAGDLITMELAPMTAAGDSGWFDVHGFGFTSHMLSFTYNTQPTGVTVKLQCSNDAGSTSSDLGSSTSTTGATIQASGTCGWVNVNISGLTGSIRIRPVYRGFGSSSSSLAGMVKIDQTTPGTTNAVSLAQIGATTVVTGGVNGSLGIGGNSAAGATATGTNPVLIAGTNAGNKTNLALNSTGTIATVTGITGQDAVGNTAVGTLSSSAADGYSLATLNFSFNGTTWDRSRTAGIGNNVASTGIGAVSLYNEYNTPQSNSTAPLGNITTAQSAKAQSDINGRLIVTPGVTQMAWQPSQVSGITATTTTRNTFTGLGQFNSCYVLLRTTATGTATATLQIYIQDSSDGGTTWDDLISSNTIAFGAAVSTQRFTLSGQVVGATITTAASTNITQGGTTAVETLAAGSARQGPWGDQVRIREKVTAPSGSPVGITYKIDATCKN